MPRAATTATIHRFGLTARLAHWLLATTFFVMLGTGLLLYVPSLAVVIDRPTAKAWHLYAAIALPVGLTLLVLAGDRRSLGHDVRAVDAFDADDLAWLRGGPRRLVTGAAAPPQGRFNAGQKLNAALVTAMSVVMGITGTLLWYGERDTGYRFAGTVTVHDWVAVTMVVLVCGHLYLALLAPATRKSFRGITLGDVDREWAQAHHAKWVATEDALAASGRHDPTRP